MYDYQNAGCRISIFWYSSGVIGICRRELTLVRFNPPADTEKAE